MILRRAMRFGATGCAVLLAAIFLCSNGWGAESSGTVGGRKVTLTGIIRIGATNLVCMVPGLNDHQSFPNILEEDVSFGGLEVKSATFYPPAATFEREGEKLALQIADGGNAKGSGTSESGTVGFRAAEMTLRQFIEAYQRIHRTTVVHPARLPAERITFFAEGRASEVKAKMNEALKAKGFAVTNLAEKISAVVPSGAKVQWPEKAEKLSRYKNLRDEIVPFGALKMSEMPFDQFLQIYEMFSKLKVVREANIRGVSLTLTSGSDLTRREVMDVFNALLAVNGFHVEDAGEGQVKLKHTAR